MNQINICAGYMYAFVECWNTVYVAPTGLVILDQEAGVTFGMFQDLAMPNGIEQQLSLTESNNPIRFVELFHAPLRKFYQVLQIVPHSLDKK